MKNISLKFDEFLAMMRGKEQIPLSMAPLLRPFGLSYVSKEEKGLMVGWVLEELAGEFQCHDEIDPIDVATAAYAIGYDDAERFLDDAPDLIYHAVRAYDSFLT
jgi:hypothetical protein